jgi:ABC-type dipeptide/oligopeptide/nickel transport system ATPase component
MTNGAVAGKRATGPLGLTVENLFVSYSQGEYDEPAVKGVSFTVAPGEIVGIVGESGSGKSSLAQAILRLSPETARVTGRIKLGTIDLLNVGEKRMRQIRGASIGMVFQDPSAALNPVFRISTQIVDTFRRHRPGLSRREALKCAEDAVEAMGVPASRLASYPHQLSGGMRQRALIAAAMAAEPKVLVADEPTSDLDTVSQAQILALLRSLRDSRGIGVLLISHDMRVISSICDRIAVMRGGVFVEVGTTAKVLGSPEHAYTRGLVRVSIRDRDDSGRFVTIADDGDDEAEPAGADSPGAVSSAQVRGEPS